MFDAPNAEISARRRAMLAEGRRRDPNFVLSKAEYDAAAGSWTVRLDEHGAVTVNQTTPERPGGIGDIGDIFPIPVRKSVSDKKRGNR